MNGTFQGKTVNMEINDGAGWQPLGDVNGWKYESANDARERIHPTPKGYEFHCTFTPGGRPPFGCTYNVTFKHKAPQNRIKKMLYRLHQRERDRRYQRRAHRIYRKHL